MTNTEFLQEVKRYVHELDPQAEVWLFGSRARGDFREDSDWDFLILSDKPVDRNYKRLIRDHLFYLGLDSERIIGTIIQNKSTWETLELTNLHQNIREDGQLV
ncbi:nucleotidyltransferase domain-containing protein [Spirosoma endbachense]|uniref:Nucleotidyltransferase domain-containing protein n=1 Tax=Spirosoma endbachense TaxID=2666025 RepID=A0A6P1W207_9BACT|nr:nucleotidyltransferase domain-containing protein [Spirosoma endbachense]QHV99075.1 nucleotidyltransferase domain-containing protein [Spirosoma endbachense]